MPTRTTTSSGRSRLNGAAAPQAQAPAAAFNYDESKVPPYQLPDPLLLNNGERVTNAETWTRLRRPEVLEMFRTQMFGRRPSAPADMKFKVFDEARAWRQGDKKADHHLLLGR